MPNFLCRAFVCLSLLAATSIILLLLIPSARPESSAAFEATVASVPSRASPEQLKSVAPDTHAAGPLLLLILLTGRGTQDNSLGMPDVRAGAAMPMLATCGQHAFPSRCRGN